MIEKIENNIELKVILKLLLIKKHLIMRQINNLDK